MWSCAWSRGRDASGQKRLDLLQHLIDDVPPKVIDLAG